MKKAVKIAGHLLMAAAVVFLIKKIIDMHVDFAAFASPRVLGALLVGIFTQCATVVMGTYPWLVFTRALSGKAIPFSKAMPVFTRSNLYKYVPGNVFQYIGRNKLASDMQIPHADVACATILDILMCVPAAGVVSLILLRHTIGELLEHYWKHFLVIFCIGMAVLIAAAIVLRLKFWEKVQTYLSRYAAALRKENRPMLLRGIGYYFVQFAFSALMYFIALSLIFDGAAETGTLVTLTGAFVFAWIVGYITPGAPGGIGIRESVMMLVSGAAYEQQVLQFVLVMRIASILADVIAFLIGTVYLRTHKA